MLSSNYNLMIVESVATYIPSGYSQNFHRFCHLAPFWHHKTQDKIGGQVTIL